MLRTPLGRQLFVQGVRYWAWPLYRAAANVYRKTLLGNTHVVAVVGSYGKSTTVRAVNSALLGDSSRSIERNSWSSIAQSILSVHPDQMHAVVEVGIDGPGQMTKFAKFLKPGSVIVTSIGSEHNRSLLTLERTRDEKAEMVRVLTEDNTVFLNGDDPNVLWMKSQTPAKIVTFGQLPTNDVVAEDVELDWPRGTSLTVRAGGVEKRLRVRLLGRKMVYPILAAVAAALHEGLTLDDIAESLETLSPTPGRLETIELESGAFILRDEFKSSLETIESALDVFEAIPAERKLVVMGEVSEPPGSQGPIYRQIGERMGRIASMAVIVGGNFQRYAAGCKRGGLPPAAIVDAGQSVRKVVRLLQEQLRAGDVVLIKGRDTQKLDRIALSLMGTRVKCGLTFCDAKLRCAKCPMVESGWSGRRPVI